MKLRKYFIAFSILLAFGICVSAQDKTPKIVWKNLQEKYERFGEIKPSIINNENASISFYEPDYSVTLYYFSEDSKVWEPSEPFMCLTDVKLSSLKVKPDQKFTLSFSTNYWDIRMDEQIGLGKQSIKNLYLSGKARFKLLLNLKIGKSAIYTQSMSPEFIVVPN